VIPIQQLKGMVNVGVVIGVFLAIVVGLSLLPTIADLSIGANETDSNITGITKTILNLVPVFFIIGMLILVVTILKISGKI